MRRACPAGRHLEALGEGVGPDHDQFDRNLAALLELRLYFTDVCLKGPAEHMYLENARGHAHPGRHRGSACAVTRPERGPTEIASFSLLGLDHRMQ